MAYVFYAAIHRALSKVKPAAKMTETTATVCDKEEAGNGIYAGKPHPGPPSPYPLIVAVS